MAWHDSWREMRGKNKVNGLSMNEVLRSLKESGLTVSEWTVRRAIRAGRCGKPTRHYGAFRFTNEHLNQLREFFESRQQRRTECATT